MDLWTYGPMLLLTALLLSLSLFPAREGGSTDNHNVFMCGGYLYTTSVGHSVTQTKECTLSLSLFPAREGGVYR